MCKLGTFQKLCPTHAYGKRTRTEARVFVASGTANSACLNKHVFGRWRERKDGLHPATRSSYAYVASSYVYVASSYAYVHHLLLWMPLHSVESILRP